MTADQVSVKVRRLDIPRFRVFQVAAGAGIALSVIGRRVQGFPFSVCVSEYVIALFLGLRAYGWLGRRDIAFLADHILIGEGGPPLHPRDVRMWGVGEGEVGSMLPISLSFGACCCRTTVSWRSFGRGSRSRLGDPGYWLVVARVAGGPLRSVWRSLGPVNSRSDSGWALPSTDLDFWAS